MFNIIYTPVAYIPTTHVRFMLFFIMNLLMRAIFFFIIAVLLVLKIRYKNINLEPNLVLVNYGRYGTVKCSRLVGAAEF